MSFVFRPSGVFAPKFAPKINVTRPSRTEEAMRRQWRGAREGLRMLEGIGLGAGLMYLFDPDRGRRRRAMLRDQASQVIHETGEALDKGVRDLNNRLSGGAIEVLSVFTLAKPSDEVLTQRIRSALGRAVSHPHAIEVKVEQGKVTLSGHILAQDVERLTTAVRRMKGVSSVTDQLTVHATPGDVPDLQGKPRLARERSPLEPRWTPATRLTVATAGCFLAAYGTARRGLAGFGFGLIGLGMIGRAMKRPLPHAFGAGTDMERGIDLQKTITIDAPVERVFRMLANPEEFPRFMSHVQEVKKLDDGGYRWTVVGPGGAALHWDAEITRTVENQVLEWKTRPGAAVEHAGLVRFDPTAYGGTRVHVRMSYRPPLGHVGETLGEILNLYPRHLLDDDLARFKSLLEHGKTTAHHRKVRLEQVINQ